MKKIFLMCCLVIGFAAASHAQGGGRMRMSPADMAKNLQTVLKLTDDQTTKVQAIYQAQATKMDSIRTAANGDFSSMRSAMQPLRQATNEKVNALLTDEQKAAFKKYQEEARARMQNGGGAPPSNR